MRAVLLTRGSAVKAQAINQLRALLISASQKVSERLLRIKPANCVQHCAALRSLGKSVVLQTLTMCSAHAS